MLANAGSVMHGQPKPVAKHSQPVIPIRAASFRASAFQSCCSQRKPKHMSSRSPHASRRQVLDASASVTVLAAGETQAAGQTAGAALAAQSSGQQQDDVKHPPAPNDLTRMRAHW